MKNIIILGSTGSIGTQVTDVVRRMASRFRIVGLSAHSNIPLLKEQIREFRPRIVTVGSEAAVDELTSWCRKNRLSVTVNSGLEGLIETAEHPDGELVLSSVVGAVGLQPLMAALRSGKDVALANKEALVVAGDLIMKEARRRHRVVLPVDSEHSAIFQCLKNEGHKAVRRILLTASGGPFYRLKKEQSDITVEEALAHPTWIMGKKITIDSATLMNKGLEAIEASKLFGVPLENIEIIIHPQSIVHSMVEFSDGSVIAQLSMPDMRLPIQYALTWPGRCPSPVKPLDLARVQKLEFDIPDFSRFPCLALALKAGKKGGTLPAVMNAANEVAVQGFLSKQVRFDEIPRIIEKVMKAHAFVKNPGMQKLLDVDADARRKAKELLQRSGSGGMRDI
jgi:1-deoxy-D-xylulose-5-phosphate reductoisomerase